jgi:hypothetical protein
MKKEGDNVLKYGDLLIGIQRTWNVKAKVVSVIISATGGLPLSFQKHLDDIPDKHYSNK